MPNRLLAIESSCLNEGRLINILYDGKALQLKNSTSNGIYISKVFELPFLCEEIIPSWNILCPQHSSYSVEIRCSKNNLQWSNWLTLGAWQRQYKNRALCDDNLKIDTDVVISGEGFSYVQLKFDLYGDKLYAPSIKSINLALSSSKFTPGMPANISGASCVNELNIPFRSQYWEKDDINSHICSATSVAMVLDFWGKSIPTREIALKVYDSFYNMYGIWWRSIQAASEYGFKAWVQYFKSLEDASSYISKGIPVIACVSYNRGELMGAPCPETKGHVLVISGFDDCGNVICRDSAAKQATEGRITYDSREFSKAWFSNAGGVGYIICQ